METDKFKAFEDFCNGFIANEIGDERNIPALIATLKKLLDELLQEIELNEYKILPPNTFKEYREKKYTVIISSLKKMREFLTPTIQDIPIYTGDENEKSKKRKRNYRLLSNITVNPLRLAVLRTRMSNDEADKRIKDETKFIDEKMKEIEMKKSELKDPIPEDVKEESSKTLKDKLTHKQQILLLHSLGFFESQFFTSLNETQKGVLVAHIVNRDEKNSEDNIRYVKGKRASENTKQIFTKSNINAVNKLLERIGLNDNKIL